MWLSGRRSGEAHKAFDLRPMNLGEILDRALEIYRDSFWQFVGIASIPAVIMLGLRVADLTWLHTERLIRISNRGQATLWSLAVSLAYYHISSFLSVLILPAYVTTSAGALFGEKNSIIAAFRSAAARWRTYLWIGVLKVAVELVAPEILGFSVLIGAVLVLELLRLVSSSAVVIVVMLIVITGTVYLFLWIGAAIAFAIPVSALEGRSGNKSLRRSWILTKGNRRRIILTWVSVFICSLTISLAIEYLLRLLANFFYHDRHLLWFNRILYLQLASFAIATINSFLGPIYPIALTLLYFDQRVRKEGFDLEKMMEHAGWTIAPELIPVNELRNANLELEGAESLPDGAELGNSARAESGGP